MHPDLTITNVLFTSAPSNEVERGMLGWLTVTLNDALRIDGLTLRRTATGKLTISYPERVDRHGVEHRYLVPLNYEIRQHIEGQILAAIGHKKGVRS